MHWLFIKPIKCTIRFARGTIRADNSWIHSKALPYLRPLDRTTPPLVAATTTNRSTMSRQTDANRDDISKPR
jgi:hypothetical protein